MADGPGKEPRRSTLNLLPQPRFLEIKPGKLLLPGRVPLQLDNSLPSETALAIAERLQSAAKEIGVGLSPEAIVQASRALRRTTPAPASVRAVRNDALRTHAHGYKLTIDRQGVLIEFHEPGGLRAGVATLRQLFRECGHRLPCLKIRDWPDFPRRGVMLDVSRGRVPKLETLLELVDHLADFKINEFQLYTEHTFAFRNYEPVWRGWGAITAAEIQKLDARCHELGVDLVPNQNSFGHLRYWLEYPPLKKLAEVSEAYEAAGGAFLRYPSTLAPNHPGTIPFLRELYDELLPNFSGEYFNAGCDETWDLGRGQSRKLCEKKGKGRVYLELLKGIHREVSARGRKMMFWGDIILHYPELVSELPENVIALNWGYEAKHPFAREAAIFAASKIPFYVCPGTSAWMTLIGRHDNAFANLRQAAKIGRKNGAMGYLNTDWGDGGHPQPLAVSYLPYLMGAAAGWSGAAGGEAMLVHAINRDVFQDPTGRAGKAALALGLAHRKFKYFPRNETPFGAVIAAPPPERRELFCRDGLKYYARIPARNIRAALEEVETQRTLLKRARPASRAGKVSVQELDLAARMAVQSCKFMLWQQALAAGKDSTARRLAKDGIQELRELDRDFRACWPLRNKGTTDKCSPFLRWRAEDYRRGVLYFPPEAAAKDPGAGGED